LWALGLVLILCNLASFGYTYNNSVAVILLDLAFWVLYFWIRAGSIVAIKAVVDQQETSLEKSLTAGRLFFGRLLGASALLGIVTSLAWLIVSTPILYMLGHHLVWQAVVLIVFGSVLLIPASIIVLLMSLIAPMFVVLYDFKIGEAISSSFDLVAKYWKQLVVFGLILVALNLGILLLTVILTALSLVPFVLLAILTYHKISVAIPLVLMVGGIVTGLIVFLAIQSAMAIFTQTTWVLAFLEIIKPQKLEEEQPVAMPEIVE
jgi:hypothetical protein